MSVPTPIEPAETLARDRDELRSIIDEALWGCAIHSNIGRDYVTLGDDAGLEYAIRNVVARIKIARDVLAMLKATKPPEIADAA
jgi:hypothetical protein